MISCNICRLQTSFTPVNLLHFAFCIFHHFYKNTLLAMHFVCLVYLTFLTIQRAYLLSNIIRGDSYGNIYGYFFNNSQIIILKCAKAISAVHWALYSLYDLGRENGPGTCVPMVNWNTLMKYNICSYTSTSVCTIFSTRIIERHQLVLSLNASLSQKLRWRCIFNVSIIL